MLPPRPSVETKRSVSISNQEEVLHETASSIRLVRRRRRTVRSRPRRPRPPHRPVRPAHTSVHRRPGAGHRATSRSTATNRSLIRTSSRLRQRPAVPPRRKPPLSPGGQITWGPRCCGATLIGIGSPVYGSRRTQAVSSARRPSAEPPPVPRSPWTARAAGAGGGGVAEEAEVAHSWPSRAAWWRGRRRRRRGIVVGRRTPDHQQYHRNHDRRQRRATGDQQRARLPRLVPRRPGHRSEGLVPGVLVERVEPVGLLWIVGGKRIVEVPRGLLLRHHQMLTLRPGKTRVHRR